MRGLGSLLLTVGVLLLGLAVFCWWEGSTLAKVAAYVAVLLGLVPLSWGLLLCWHQQAWSGFVAAALALIAGLMTVPGFFEGLAPACLVIVGLSLATVVGGICLGRRRLRQSTRTRSS